jgi:hypothetical protein
MERKRLAGWRWTRSDWPGALAETGQLSSGEPFRTLSGAGSWWVKGGVAAEKCLIARQSQRHARGCTGFTILH